MTRIYQVARLGKAYYQVKVVQTEDVRGVPQCEHGTQNLGLLRCDPVAGVLMANKALKIVWQTFQREGGQIIDNNPVKKPVRM